MVILEKLKIKERVVTEVYVEPLLQFQMYQWEVEFDPRFFHMAKLKVRDYHNAYDADENSTMFRADAIFRHDGSSGEFEVPIFRAKIRDDGRFKWCWLLRFRPHLLGKWELSVYVVHRYPTPDPSNPVFERVHEPAPLRRFSVVRSKLWGPLETPSGKDNRNYFYRVQPDGERKPCFLLGFARPWVTHDNRSPWDNYHDRHKQLFRPMADAGCNILYHWMMAGESFLVHRSRGEFWFNEREGFFKGVPRRGSPSYEVRDKALGYKRYDQARAAHTDAILEKARITVDDDDLYILLCIAVMPHSLLQDESHPWPEDRWTKPRSSEYKPWERNGFSLFEDRPGHSIDIRQFFQMFPGATKGSWQLRLWRHFANFWRYVIGRWSAHPAVGAWVIMDELEGVGGDKTHGTRWWWINKDVTYPWHDNVVRLLRGEVVWGRIKGRELKYTGDYLKHPLTSSTTHYMGSEPFTFILYPKTVKEAWPDFRGPTPQEKRALLNYQKPTATAMDAVKLIDTLGELPDHIWRGRKHENFVDFYSHHTYQAVPARGVWVKQGGRQRYVSYNTWRADPRTNKVPRWLEAQCMGRDIDLRLPNQGCTIRIDADRWLYDSLCMRLRNWSRATRTDIRTKGAPAPCLITEYGAYEREEASQLWEHYGKRFPTLLHYANWAALATGHAGVPFKWNDGKRHGEMVYRDGNPVWKEAEKEAKRRKYPWKKDKYPVNNLVEITNIARFLIGVDLHRMQPAEFEVCHLVGNRRQRVEIAGGIDKFNAWGLIANDATSAIAWIYDREFTAKGRSFKPGLRLKVRFKSKLARRRAYFYQWYDPWTGRPLESKDGKLRNETADDGGVLEIKLPKQFPLCKNPEHRKTVQGFDGNDIALKISAVPVIEIKAD